MSKANGLLKLRQFNATIRATDRKLAVIRRHSTAAFPLLE